MSLRTIVDALGGDLYDGGRRALVPAPGHSPADRSVSLLLTGGRLLIHSFGEADWRAVRDDLQARGLLDALGRSAAGEPADDGPGAMRPARAARVAAAEGLWLGGAPLARQTPAARYCRRRAVAGPLETLGALRSHPAAPLSVYAAKGPTRPALLAAVVDPAGTLTAVEATYLTPSGDRARDLRLPRKTVGTLGPGSAVRLSPAAPHLLVGEGVFTTLSAMARFQLPGWALLSTTNLRRWTPPEGVRRVLIAADRGTDGERSAARLAAALAARGVPAEVRLPPPEAGDWNDLAQEEARRKGGQGRPARREGP